MSLRAVRLLPALVASFLGPWACTAVKDEFRCADDRSCVLEGRYGGRCETIGYCSFGDPRCLSQQRYGPWAGAYSELCVGEIPLDSPDATVTNPQMNDHPSSPFELSGQEQEVAFDLDSATRDLETQACNDRGDPDLFYSFSLPQEEVVYLAALGSGVSMTVASGHCGSFPIAPDFRLFCGDKTCEDGSAQLAELMPPGLYCVVLNGTGQGTLRFVRGGRSGTAAVLGQNTIDTCSASNLATPSCIPGSTDVAPEVALYLLSCQRDVTVFALGGGPTYLYVRAGSAFSSDVACGADSVVASVQPGLVWVLAELNGGCVSGSEISINW